MRRHVSMSHLRLLRAWCRGCSDSSAPPTPDEINRAHGVLGTGHLQAGGGGVFAEVRRKYLELARTHHPDVSGGGGDSMGDINAAYAVLERANKHGLLDRAQAKASQPGGSHPFRQAPSWGGGPDEQDAFTQGFHEAMWGAMRDKGFAGMRGGHPGGGPFPDFEDGYAYASSVGRRNRRQWERGRGRGKAAGDKDGGGGATDAKSSSEGGHGNDEPGGASSALSVPEQRAMRHMYEEGRSFDFIANALGKPQTVIIEEFNRSADRGRRGPQNHRRGGRGGRGQRGGRYPNPYYDVFDYVIMDDDDDHYINIDPQFGQSSFIGDIEDPDNYDFYFEQMNAPPHPGRGRGRGGPSMSKRQPQW